MTRNNPNYDRQKRTKKLSDNVLRETMGRDQALLRPSRLGAADRNHLRAQDLRLPAGLWAAQGKALGRATATSSLRAR